MHELKRNLLENLKLSSSRRFFKSHTLLEEIMKSRNILNIQQTKLNFLPGNKGNFSQDSNELLLKLHKILSLKTKNRNSELLKRSYTNITTNLTNSNKKTALNNFCDYSEIPLDKCKYSLNPSFQTLEDKIPLKINLRSSFLGCNSVQQFQPLIQTRNKNRILKRINTFDFHVVSINHKKSQSLNEEINQRNKVRKKNNNYHTEIEKKLKLKNQSSELYLTKKRTKLKKIYPIKSKIHLFVKGNRNINEVK